MELATKPLCRSDLVFRPLGNGPCVVKDPRTGAYFQLGEEEHFLLTHLDGQKDAAGVCRAFGEHFGQPLTEEDLAEFVQLARARGLLQTASVGRQPDDFGEPGCVSAGRFSRGADATPLAE